MKFVNKVGIVSAIIFSGATMAASDFRSEKAYCIDHDGKVESMVAKFGSDLNGFEKEFCTFEKGDGFIAVGLDTYASEKPSIAATYIQRLNPIPDGSSLREGPETNPSMNVCTNLGGSSITFNVVSGGFTNNLGASDICTFGDGSMVSAWSLMYMADGRQDYDQVKDTVRSEPISFMYIPGQ
ncbi:DUF333 domain-containing protein [Vibrio marisflavi]|uniref:Hemolysin n=1 Tax=Vibrio marisflavi CECT 7928 TaxID=634439 RepID=A0ABM8ZYS3_9VIBR|nr:DUF333 domain-containing protein [Vibrio marisflavi]CAH0536109.1 hypothetical protein VMF7928_00203 [Vibrio marisflavi CECT 7928]